jgi:hypothetical protein
MNVQTINQSGIYNQLAEVIEADQKLSSLNKSAILDSLCDVILKHKLEDRVGIRLLHKHNVISGHEIMLEQEEHDEAGRPCLSTFAIERNACTGKYAINSWALRNDEYVPLEYSIDPLVVEQSDLMITQKDFFIEFGQALKQMNVDDILGPCIATRSFFAHRPDVEALLVESTDEERRANILRYDMPENYESTRLIQTVWGANAESTSCPTLPGIKCHIKFVCAENSSGHYKKVDHDTEKTETHMNG